MNTASTFQTKTIYQIFCAGLPMSYFEPDWYLYETNSHKMLLTNRPSFLVKLGGGTLVWFSSGTLKAPGETGELISGFE